MYIFTIKNGVPEGGTTVETFSLSAAGIKIPAVIIGERGRGRRLGILPVHLPVNLYKEWKEKGEVRIFRAKVGKTKAGNPKLYAEEVDTEVDTNDEVIVVLRTHIGFRGSNSHTGDIKGQWWELDPFFSDVAEKAGVPKKERYSKEEVEKYTPELLKAKWPNTDPADYRWDAGFKHKREFLPFPGKILVEGTIAQGAAGRMGSGKQMVALVPKNTVFRTGYSGRLYGAPREHYYLWDGKELISATMEEREIADLF